ncbi:unnamed protein product, partial [Rotaria magnacalcarata]
MEEEPNGDTNNIIVNLPQDPIKNLTVAEMYDKEKYDLSTM